LDLWRISNHVSLAGDGGLKASGRWHTRGRRVVYCAQTPAAALLEVLVHFEIGIADLPLRYRLLRIDAPDEVAVERLEREGLAADWFEQMTMTRAIGDAWLTRGSSALFAVPSAIVPATENVLLNPAHADASRITVIDVSEHAVDRRLLAQTG
jgi:RES domain-containing protein